MIKTKQFSIIRVEFDASIIDRKTRQDKVISHVVEYIDNVESYDKFEKICDKLAREYTENRLAIATNIDATLLTMRAQIDVDSAEIIYSQIKTFDK